MKNKIIVGLTLILVALTSISVWAYYAPHRTLDNIKLMAEKGDSEGLRELIDFPSVREGMKEQLNAYMLKQMATELKGNPFAAFGMMFAGALVDRVVDSFVTPTGIASFSKGIKPKINNPSINQNDNNESKADNASDNIIRTNKYEGTSKFIVSFSNRNDKSKTISLILRRQGITWKLTSIVLPDIE